MFFFLRQRRQGYLYVVYRVVQINTTTIRLHSRRSIVLEHVGQMWSAILLLFSPTNIRVMRQTAQETPIRYEYANGRPEIIVPFRLYDENYRSTYACIQTKLPKYEFPQINRFRDCDICANIFRNHYSGPKAQNGIYKFIVCMKTLAKRSNHSCFFNIAHPLHVPYQSVKYQTTLQNEYNGIFKSILVVLFLLDRRNRFAGRNEG